MAAFLDASFIIAAADVSDLNHTASVAWLDRVTEPLLIAALTLGDADHLLQRGLGIEATLALLEAISTGGVRMVTPTGADLERASELLSTAREHRPRLADAVLVAGAERLGVRRVATFERRPLAILRPAGLVLDLEP